MQVVFTQASFSHQRLGMLPLQKLQTVWNVLRVQACVHDRGTATHASLLHNMSAHPCAAAEAGVGR